jgi:hypothetical protein
MKKSQLCVHRSSNARILADRAAYRYCNYLDHCRDCHPQSTPRKDGGEQASGLSNLGTITSAAITFSSTYNNGYPPNLATLGEAGLATCNGAILLDDTLTIPPF